MKDLNESLTEPTIDAIKEIDIEELIYRMKIAKDERLPKPIFFLGAGASKTGGIPLAGDIVIDVLNKFGQNPNIKNIRDEDKVYSKLMDKLLPAERNNLLKSYIDKAKINITHICLAQLLHEGFIDYILTVNFDNLMQRACALYNDFPATYDMAILKDLTTTSFKEKSIIYLHGQHHGLWLLNTREEMKKVNDVIPPIFHSIKNKRPWVFIGYSGSDLIFNHIKDLGRFDDGLYWVTFNNNPSKEVCNDLFHKPNTNAAIIKGYDSDSFMLKLTTGLELPQPNIIDKPFTSLKNILESIVDIDDKEHFQGVKVRLEVVKSEVDKAIQQFENGKFEAKEKNELEIRINNLKRKIVDIVLKQEFDENDIKFIDDEIKVLNVDEVNALYSDLYLNWGIYLFHLAKSKKSQELYEMSIEKFEKAKGSNPNLGLVLFNLGTAMSQLAHLKNKEELYFDCIDIFQKSYELKYYNSNLFNNWGAALLGLGKLKRERKYFEESINKFRIAIELNALDDSAHYNWGNALLEIASLENSEQYYLESISILKKAVGLNPDNDYARTNIGVAYLRLGILMSNPELFWKCCGECSISVILNPKNQIAFYNYGSALFELIKSDPKNHQFISECIAKLKRSEELGGPVYNYACALAWKNDPAAFLYLEKSLEKNEIDIPFIEKDTDWDKYREHPEYINILVKHKGKEM